MQFGSKLKSQNWQGITIQIPYSIKEEDKKYLKLKCVDSLEKKGFLLKVFQQDATKKLSQYLLNSTTMEPTWRKQSMILPKILEKGKKPMTTTDKEDFEGSSNLKTFRHHAMYTFF